MLLAKNDECIGDDSNDDRRDAVQNVRDEAYRVPEAIAAEFGEINARTDADRNSEQAGDAENQHGPSDGIGHAAAGFARRLGSLGKEREIDGTDALNYQIRKDG